MPNLKLSKYNNKSTSVCLTDKEKSHFFSLLSHTLIIYLEGGNTLLSSLLLSLFHVALLGYLSLCDTSFFGTLQHQKA